MKKLMLIALATVAMSAGAAEPNMEKYGKSCVICHAAGVAGAPKAHDTAAWEPRVAKGIEALVASVSTGLNAMPPKGMCYDCTDEEYAAMIEFMAAPAK